LSGKIVALLLVPVGAVVAAGAVALRMHFQPPTVPDYSLVGVAPGSEVTLAPGGSFTMVMQPSGQVTGIVGAHGLLLGQGQARPWDPSFSVAANGTVSVAGTREQLFPGVPPGEWDVAVAVGRPETLPTRPGDFSADHGHDDRAGFRIVHQRLHLTQP
jgi:hypothetical protein